MTSGEMNGEITGQEMMDEDLPDDSPGETGEPDIFGKLEDLISRHKPKTLPEQAPVLTEVLPDHDAIPTLTDIVSRPPAPVRETDTRQGLENALVQRLAMRLEVERARLLAESAGVDRAAVLDELIARLRESLPDIVRVAIERGERR